MKRVSINLGRINNSMTLKFALTVKEDKPIQGNQLISRFTLGGNEYMMFNLHPYVVIDIRKPGEQWSPNNSVNLAFNSILPFCKAIKNELESMRTHKDLFFITPEDGRLHVNKEVSRDCRFKVVVKQKYLGFTPMVVVDNDVDYEGVAFMINEPSNYCALTTDEMELLYSILSRLDMSLMALTLMNSYKLNKDEVEIEEIQKTFTEKSNTPEIEDRTIRKNSDDKLPDIK